MAHDLILNDGRTMPALGLGTWQLPDPQAPAIVRAGLDAGLRLIDTAAIYGNERGVGAGMTASDAWLTTKLWNDRHGDVEAALDESLALLGREAVDLYLIHWPVPGEGQAVAAWQGLIAAREAGKAGSIGVSNFRTEDLAAIVDATGVVPAVNQIELHPYFAQAELRAEHERLGIVTQSWSPLGQGGELLRDPVIVAIAERLGRTPAQVVIAWHLAHGLSVIPKTGSVDRLAENAAVDAIDLAVDDVAAIDALDRGAEGRIGPDPANFA